MDRSPVPPPSDGSGRLRCGESQAGAAIAAGEQTDLELAGKTTEHGGGRCGGEPAAKHNMKTQIRGPARVTRQDPFAGGEPDATKTRKETGEVETATSTKERT